MNQEAPVFHDKTLIGNGGPCEPCAGTGRIRRAGRTVGSKRCAPCRGTGRAPYPAERIVAETVAQVKAFKAAQPAPVPVVCGIPLPVQFGRRDDGSMWVSCGVPLRHHIGFDLPGTPRDAAAFAQGMNALPKVIEALRAVRSDCLDPDSDAVVSSAAGTLVEEALLALGVKP